MDENEFVLEDRVAKTRAVNEQHDLEHNSYYSFSGGYDSCVGSMLLDVALPNNRIPRVYFNTGIEYIKMVNFVKKLAAKDDRFIIVNSGVNIKQMLKENGYPFKSKQHSHNWAIYNNNNNKELNEIIKYLTDNPEKRFDYNYIHNLPKGIKTIVKYVFGIREKTVDIKHTTKPINEYSKEYWINDYTTEFGIIEEVKKDTHDSVVERERESIITSAMSTMTSPECLRYQFTQEYKDNGVKLSDKCCYKLKKEVALKWEQENNRHIAITGIRAEEGGMRALNGCTIFDGDKLKKFHPLKVVSKEWEEWFVKKYNIELCELYYPPYNFKRTGCNSCPFSLDIQEQLEKLYKLLPIEYKKAKQLWKPVFDEYIRIGYRLKYYPDEVGVQLSIFDIEKED